jgi:hypothetical protein
MTTQTPMTATGWQVLGVRMPDSMIEDARLALGLPEGITRSHLARSVVAFVASNPMPEVRRGGRPRKPVASSEA